MRTGVSRTVGLVAAASLLTVTACGGGSDEGTSTSTSREDLPSLQEALTGDLDDHRGDIERVLGQPDAFRVTFVPVDGGVVRRESWDYLELETRIDFVDGSIAFTGDLEPSADGTWYAHHVAPGDFEQGMTPSEVRAQLAGLELEELDLSDVVDEGTALVGSQLLVAFSGGEIVSAESFALAPDPDGQLAQLIETVTP